MDVPIAVVPSHCGDQSCQGNQNPRIDAEKPITITLEELVSEPCISSLDFTAELFTPTLSSYSPGHPHTLASSFPGA